MPHRFPFFFLPAPYVPLQFPLTFHKLPFCPLSWSGLYTDFLRSHTDNSGLFHNVYIFQMPEKTSEMSPVSDLRHTHDLWHAANNTDRFWGNVSIQTDPWLVHSLFQFSVLTENPHPFSFPPRIVSIKYNSDSCRKDSLAIYIFLSILPDTDFDFWLLPPPLFLHIGNAMVHCWFLWCKIYWMDNVW